MVNLCLHSRHKLIRYNKQDWMQQMWSPLVSDDLSSCVLSAADGQKRKKSLRRKLDSLAKEKSKDKGRPRAFLSAPLHLGQTRPQAVASTRQAGEETMLWFTGLEQIISCCSGGTARDNRQGSGIMGSVRSNKHQNSPGRVQKVELQQKRQIEQDVCCTTVKSKRAGKLCHSCGG